jgi:hypothetical protein
MNLFVLALAFLPAVVFSSSPQLTVDNKGGVKISFALPPNEVAVSTGKESIKASATETIITETPKSTRNLATISTNVGVACTVVFTKVHVPSGNDKFTINSWSCKFNAVTFTYTGPHTVTVTAGPSEVFEIPPSVTETVTVGDEQLTFVQKGDNQNPAGIRPTLSEGALLEIISEGTPGSLKITEFKIQLPFHYYKGPSPPTASAFSVTGTIAGVAGDPHFQTWSGARFDYQGQCEMTLLRAPRVDLDVNIRTKIQGSYSFVER